MSISVKQKNNHEQRFTIHNRTSIWIVVDTAYGFEGSDYYSYFFI